MHMSSAILDTVAKDWQCRGRPGIGRLPQGGSRVLRLQGVQVGSTLCMGFTRAAQTMATAAGQRSHFLDSQRCFVGTISALLGSGWH